MNGTGIGGKYVYSQLDSARGSWVISAYKGRYYICLDLQ